MDPALDLLKQILGTDVSESRLAQNLDAYRAILVEIQKLRSLDLTDVHPAIVYDPLMPYRHRPSTAA